MATTRELRTLSSRATLRTAGGRTIIGGYASVFNSLSEDLGGFNEIISPGTFDRALKEKQDVRALVNHDPNLILGRTKSGTLTLSEDGVGLHFEVMLPKTSYADDLVVSMQRGDISQCSFGFKVRDGGDTWKTTDTQKVLRVISDVDLYDVSVVTTPAYQAATAQIVDSRALIEARSISSGKIVVPQVHRREMTLEELRAMAAQQGRDIAREDYAAAVEEWRTSKYFFKL